MTHAKTIGRRELLRGGGVAALAVAGAALVPFAAKAAAAHHQHDLALKALWEKRTAAWVVANDAQDQYDEAHFKAIAPNFSLDQPWAFVSLTDRCGWDSELPFGCVEERQMRQALERRIFFYPDATSAEDAERLSKERHAAEVASRDREVRRLHRKHRVAALNRENERLHDVPRAIETEISRAQFVGALGVAIKLGLYFTNTGDKPTLSPKCSDGDHFALSAVYYAAVSECGFDPVEEFYGTKGI